VLPLPQHNVPLRDLQVACLVHLWTFRDRPFLLLFRLLAHDAALHLPRIPRDGVILKHLVEPNLHWFLLPFFPGLRPHIGFLLLISSFHTHCHLFLVPNPPRSVLPLPQHNASWRDLQIARLVHWISSHFIFSDFCVCRHGCVSRHGCTAHLIQPRSILWSLFCRTLIAVRRYD